MDFVIRKNGRFCILDTSAKNFNEFFLERLKKFLSNNFKKRKNIAINCANVESIEFAPVIEYFNKNKLALLSLNPLACAQAGLLNYDSFVNLYMCEKDFVQNKRKLVKRRFKVV